MVYDTSHAERVQKLIGRRKGISQKKMFGGLGFLLYGNMCVGIWREFLILRVGPDAYRTALEQADTRQFDITGRPMRGWIMVEPNGYATAAQLRMWIDMAFDFVRSLPPKELFPPE